MKKFYYAFLWLVVIPYVTAQDKTIEIPISAVHWNVPEGATFEKFDNRATLVLASGRATVKNQIFTDGTLEVDVYGKTKRSFAGISFREQNDNLEEVYLRLHKSNQVDAVQYTPLFNNESNWQLYHQHQAKASFKTSGWNTLRIEVKGNTADVFVNDEKLLHVDELRTEGQKGIIGLWALFGNRFSNFRVTHKMITEVNSKSKNESYEEHIISNWWITKAYQYEGNPLDVEMFKKLDYTQVSTESSGLLPISKYVRKTSSGNFEQNKEDYIIASTTIHTEKDTTRLFSFDYSDKIIVYLNGKRIFKGSNAFRQKGIQYMGHLNINTNQLYLQLKKGENHLHCAVIDKANGWGLMGKLE